MAPIILPNLSSHLFLTKVANSTSFTKKPFSQSFDTLPTSVSSPSTSILLSKSPIPTVLPHLFHEKFSTIIVKAPTTTYTSYTEVDNNAIASEPTALPDSTPVGDSVAVETDAPKPNNAGRDVGIVIGCIVGVVVLGLVGWVYMMRAQQRQRKRKRGKKERGKGEGKEDGGRTEERRGERR
ncbi:hypothetical protein sscle_03g024050 [Sclerotinia sclerotiorum 1980 UF-70]|uniref:Mid2 domain-containing protein n=1 Tax=Sclerotinia sclerotiorum (strain ATCC 18683 / 1980 / Ss-1) TaxID=665079 RepID=A0A1D9PY30_SCLS1|nr:hypothetical protein sscle_03g024050 [Sclerotinia sclerotiorum 1980 UF-70]